VNGQSGNPLVLNMSSKTSCALVTTAIGDKYMQDWTNFSKPLWEKYAERHSVAIIVVTEDLISRDSDNWKNGSWQKLLLPQMVTKLFPNISRICILDTDVIMNPLAPNIFDFAPPDHFSVVSLESKTPYPIDEVKRRIAFFRHNYYSRDYPLESLLFASSEETMTMHGLPTVNQSFCSGLFVADTKQANLMSDWFYSVTNSEVASSVAWEQPYLNNWIQNQPHHWLPYEFQAIWNYEMAWKYPYLYGSKDTLANSQTARDCVESSLWTNHFLHFAGSWFESQARFNTGLLLGNRPLGSFEQFMNYMETPVTGKPKGKILP